MANSDSVDSTSAAVVSPPRDVAAALRRGVVIPAHPLAINSARRLDERRQRALSRYYLAAGAGGLAVGVHTTQFAIRRPDVGLLAPVWKLAAEEMDRHESRGGDRLVRVAGICGDTNQAVAEAQLARDLGYHYGLVNLGALRGATVPVWIAHCRAIAEVINVFGFYLQPSVGGVKLPFEFWSAFCEIDGVAAIKVAAFDRYQTIDVVRAVAASGRSDIALYTGNDDNIVADLLTQYRFPSQLGDVTCRFVGGLLGHWAVWTLRAAELLRQCHAVEASTTPCMGELLTLAVEVTDANGAIFDAAHGFRGCLPGIHEVLRRQGLLEGTWCLDEQEQVSPGQIAEIERVISAYPHLTDDDFVSAHIDQWLR